MADATHHATHAAHHAGQALKGHKMNKTTLFIIGGGVLLVLVYLYYRNSQNNAAQQAAANNNANAQQNPPDTIGTSYDQGASDYATLAGDIQQTQATQENDFLRLQRRIQAMMKKEKNLQKSFNKYKRRHHNPHENHHHPGGTGGHGVGPRHHGPHNPRKGHPTGGRR